MKELTGTGALIRLILRRDRVWLPIWVLLPMLLAWSQVSFVTALPDLWGFIAELNANPLTGAVLGPVVPMTIAGAAIWHTAPQAAMVLAIASLLTVIRHTRTEEEAGRSELVRGGVVGRHAPLTAASTVTCAANLVAGLLTALVLLAGAGLPAGGAWTERLTNREGFMAVSIYIVALMVGVTVYAITTVLRLRKEEAENRAEPLLAQPVSRTQWMTSHVIAAFAGSAFLLLALGLGAGLGWGLVAGDLGVLPGVLGMSLSKAPSVWVMLGIVAVLYGLLPRAASVLSWSFLALFVVIEMAWDAQLIDWSVTRLSPFSYVHYTIPIAELPLLPLFGLILLAAALTAAGLVGFQRRDVG